VLHVSIAAQWWNKREQVRSFETAIQKKEYLSISVEGLSLIAFFKTFIIGLQKIKSRNFLTLLQLPIIY
jgi:hypothetical protein